MNRFTTCAWIETSSAETGSSHTSRLGLSASARATLNDGDEVILADPSYVAYVPGIARSLALQPKLLVADEPVSALDVSIQAQIVNLLDDLQDELGLAYLFVAHDIGVVRHISDRIAVMHDGKIVEQGSADQVCEHPKDDYTKKLLAAVPIPDPRESRERAAKA
jgi:ABC-type proline/glycine betaine transport system ATPase subunit